MRPPTAATLRRSSSGFRHRRMLLFLGRCQPDPREPILDVGGSPELWREVGYEGPVTFLNVYPEARWDDLPAGWTYVHGDGRSLPFGRGEFQVAFSNSVIEHVGEPEDQRRFAAEIRRTGRRHWVQTPYRRFPIEPHTELPGVPVAPRSSRPRRRRHLAALVPPP